MNLLIHDPPTQLEVDGIFYPIDYRASNGVAIIAIFEDSKLTKGERWQLALERLYEKVPGHSDAAIPPNKTAAAHAALDFLNCNEVLGEGKHGRLYSFSHDSKMMRSAIEKSRSIRLSSVKDFHWWELVYSFFDISEECYFSYVVGVRHRKNTGKLTKEDRAFIANNPSVVNLPKETLVTNTEKSEFDKRLEVAMRRRR